ncbi:MAG: hypothetical protein IJN88_03200 [Clostridia bacterium]|nr:hypothetical protein [Clostridia bacterium]
MKNIYTLLENIGVSIPEDKKAVARTSPSALRLPPLLSGEARPATTIIHY